MQYPMKVMRPDSDILCRGQEMSTNIATISCLEERQATESRDATGLDGIDHVAEEIPDLCAIFFIVFSSGTKYASVVTFGHHDGQRRNGVEN